MINNNTTELDDMINNINNENELKNYINSKLSPVQPISFNKYIEDIRTSKNIKKSTFIANSDISRTYAYQILNGLKMPSRDNVIKLCLAGNFSIEETNKALNLAGYNKLYSKDIRDSLIIYFLNNKYTVIDANMKLDEHNISLLGNSE
ncbi:helix-turn-helix transcriptional regulator [Clostridioides difficile]